MIFNTLIKGGITGKPIEVTELPTPTEKDVDKIYLLKKEEKEFIYPEVGQAIGDKIYFDTSVDPLNYVSNLGYIVVAVNGEEYYGLALVDILAMQNIEGYGHAYVLGMTDSTMSVILGLPYIYCDTLTVDQFNSMIGSQFDVSIPSFGWLTDVIDTSTIADWTIDENNVSSYGNIAYTDFEIKQSEEYYKVNKIEGIPIEVGKPVPNILHYDMSVTPDFSSVPADGAPLVHFITNEQYIAGVSMVAPEAETNNQGTIEVVMLILMGEMPIILYVGGTASLEVINATFGEAMGTTFTQKGWQGNGTVNITDEAIKLGTSLGAPMEQIESILAAGFADPVTTFNDPQGIFIAEDQYVFETLGGSGFPIEVEELPVATEQDVDKLYAVFKKRSPSTDDKLGNMVLYDTSIVPVVEEGRTGLICIAFSEGAASVSGFTIGSYNVDGNILIYGGTVVNDVYTISPLYAYSETLTLSEFNALIASENLINGVTIPPAKNFGWQGDGKIDTSNVAESLVAVWSDPQGIYSLASYEYYIGKEEGGTYSFAKVNPPVLQEKAVEVNGEVTADSGYDGLSKVIVNVPLEAKTITVNGTYYPSTGYQGFSSVDVNVQPNLQAKTATENGEVTADSGYDGLSKVTVNVQPNLQAKTAVPTTTVQEILPDEGYDGLSEVTVSAIKTLAQVNIIPRTNDVIYTPPEDTRVNKVIVEAIETEEKTVTENGTVMPSDGKYLSKVVVNVELDEPTLQAKTAVPTTTVQEILPDEGYDGLSEVTVSAIQTETKSVTPSTSEQTVTPSEGKYLTEVTVEAVTSSIDSNIVSTNIKEGITILGVTGSVTEAEPKAKLFAPKITLENNILTIKNPLTNKGHVSGYDICNADTGDVLKTIKVTKYDLVNLIVDDGVYNIAVKAKAELNGFSLALDSDYSNIVSYEHLNPPVVGPTSGNWYAGTTSKSTITEITFDNTYAVTGSETESWDASKESDGSVMCYLTGTHLTIKPIHSVNKVRINPSKAYSFFEGFSALTYINNIGGLYTSNVTYMLNMFYGCKALTSLDLSNFDTSKVTNMNSMFNGCKALTSLDLSNFNTSNVTNMFGMFNSCKALTSLDLSNFDTSKVTNMNSMFNGCSVLTADCSAWDVGLVTSYGSFNSNAPNVIPPVWVN